MITWNELSLSPQLLDVIEKSGYTTPTNVQALSIPEILAGHDVLVSSQTGSGKTASFVIPVVERFKNKNGTYVLALAPTREIAQQTAAVFETFGAPFGLKTVVCIGGASLPEEKLALSSSPHIIVATPGRLCDHLERGNVWLDFIQCLVFDEADRMLDMGFSKQIDIITEQIPKERQTLMFSATFAPKVEKLARSVLKNPKQIKIEKTAESTPKIEQRLLWMDEDRKLGALLNVLREETGTVIVFAKSKDKVYQLWRSLNHKHFTDVTYIHSDITQEQRESVVADYKAGKYRVLIATDVMGRGVDVDDVAHVVNFDVPRDAEDYVHRIGRTGRRGRTGIATTFAIPHRDEKEIRAIEKLLGIASPEMPPKNAQPAKQQSSPPRKPQPKHQHNQKRPQQSPPQQQNKPQSQPEPKPVAAPAKDFIPANSPVTEMKSTGIVNWLKRLVKKK